ncbi:VOC family protein [Sphingomonas phyllosphaerae]|uniref:VOC family protein n=1 Tax=Sphingomonas phyllosphaerae TaxID=257003 RepID=UPI00241348BC|nr:VOC family protein [Sphingomonas phyllosphaerae]
MDKVSVWLWCDGTAEEQATFYTGLIPDSAITSVSRAPADYPAGKAGDVLTVTFTLAGRSFAMLNGGPGPTHSEAMSLQIDCVDQAEVDHIWDAILANGGTEMACGWIKDRWSLAWQIVPRRLAELMQDPVNGPRAMTAMMTMKRIDVAALERAIAS